jgi:adenylate cyclase
VSVIAGGSAFRFRDQKEDLKAVTAALQATHIVDGALRRSDDKIRVGVNLIDATSEEIIWTTIVEHADEDIFAIRDEVAMAILAKLGRDNLDECDRGAGLSHVPDPEAYETYLQGRSLYRDRTSANLERAIAYLDNAATAAPLFADAWATLAMAHLNKVQYDYQDPLEPVPAARRAARRALELSPCMVEARLAMAIADWRERSMPVADSVAEFESVLADAPNSPTVLARMGMLYHEVGQLDNAVSMFAKAYRLDPLSANTVSFYVWMLHMAGERDEALALASASQERWPWVRNMYEVQEFPRLLAAGRYDAAREWIDEFARQEGARPTPGFTTMQCNLRESEVLQTTSGSEALYSVRHSRNSAATRHSSICLI